MNLEITSLTAGLLALLYLVLSILVIKFRMKEQETLDVPDGLIRRTVRAHGNFAEYVPIVVILMALVELQSELAEHWLTSIAGVFILGRVAHAYSIVVFEERYKTMRFRQVAMMATFIPMAILALLLIF
ncbi:MAG: MAPEG family protein [Pseudomonadota bacterium]|nr:MAPEG family protein [Pseudomonadota bacterium]